MSGQNFAVLGNSMINSREGQHVMRMPNVRQSVISHNVMKYCASSKAVMKLNAPSFSSNGHYSEYVYISNNKFEKDNVGFMITVTPQNGLEDERIRKIVLENNIFRGKTSVQSLLVISSTEITVRGNIFTAITGNSPFGININRRGVEPAPNDIVIESNTAFYPDSFTFLSIKLGGTNSNPVNNVYGSDGSANFGENELNENSNNIEENELTSYRLKCTPGDSIYIW